MSPSDQGIKTILLGTVTRPHGIKGELKVHPCTAEPENIGRYQGLFLESGQQQIACTHVKARVSGSLVILKIAECTTRNRAEELVGYALRVPEEALPELAEHEFYLHALEGKDVLTLDGEHLGRITAFLHAGGQDVLVVNRQLTSEKEEFLIPAIREFIVQIKEKECVVDLPPGLLDINR